MNYNNYHIESNSLQSTSSQQMELNAHTHHHVHGHAHGQDKEKSCCGDCKGRGACKRIEDAFNFDSVQPKKAL